MRQLTDWHRKISNTVIHAPLAPIGQLVEDIQAFSTSWKNTVRSSCQWGRRGSRGFCRRPSVAGRTSALRHRGSVTTTGRSARLAMKGDRFISCVPVFDQHRNVGRHGGRINSAWLPSRHPCLIQERLHAPWPRTTQYSDVRSCRFLSKRYFGS